MTTDIGTRLTILTSSKDNHEIKIAETLWWPVGSQHLPLGLQVSFLEMLIALTTGRGYEKEGTGIKWASLYIHIYY